MTRRPKLRNESVNKKTFTEKTGGETPSSTSTKGEQLPIEGKKNQKGENPNSRTQGRYTGGSTWGGKENNA